MPSALEALPVLPAATALPLGAVSLEQMALGGRFHVFFTDITSLAHPFCIWLQNLLSGFLGNQ